MLAGLDGALDAPAAVEAGAEGGTPEGGGASSAYAAAVLADKPVAYYRFDEDAGVTAIDSSGSGNSGVLSGSFVRGKTALITDGVSVHFGGAAQMLLDPKFDYDFGVDSTYEVWIKPDSAAPAGAVLANLTGEVGALVGVTLYFSTGSPYVGYERWDHELVRYAHVIDPVTPGPDGIYHLVVVNHDNLSSVFVNGTRTAGLVKAHAGPFTARSLVLGALAGDYDEVAIYDKALEDQRITAHYALGRGAR